MTGRWTEFKDGQYPRKGELILVRGQGENPIYPHVLYAEGQLDWWVYDENFIRFMKNNHECSGTKLSFHGLTHWMLVESPY